MFRIDTADAVASLPAFDSAGTPGYFADPTRVTRDWFNQIQEELMAVLAAGGVTPVKGTNTQLAAAIAALIAAHVPKSALLVDQKTAGTSGGTLNSGTWQTRDLNTAVYNDAGSGVTLNGDNTFTLAAGTWAIRASAPAACGNVGINNYPAGHMARLYNVTDAAAAAYGANARVDPGDAYAENQSRSEVEAKLTIASAKTFRIEHRVQGGVATTGGGFACNFGVPETYTTVAITRLQ